MRHAAQCVGRAIRGKTDYGLMVFADKVGVRASGHPHFLTGYRVACSLGSHLGVDVLPSLLTAVC